MTQLIQSCVKKLLRVLLPARGRHRSRSSVGTRAVICTAVAPIPMPRLPALPPQPEGSPRVRPYVLVLERRRLIQLQRERRQALWLALHGVDVGPYRIHGVEVAA